MSAGRITLLTPVFFLGIALSPIGSARAEALEPEIHRPVLLGPHLEILHTKGGLTLEQARAADGWKPSRERIPSFGFWNDEVWVRFQLRNSTTEARDYFLELQATWIDRMDLYAPGPEGYRRMSAGDQLPFAERGIHHRHPVFPLRVAPDATADYYLRFRSKGTLMMPLMLWPRDLFWESVPLEYVLLGIYFGTMLSLLLYNILVYATILDTNYLLYCLYMAAIITMYGILNGLVPQFLLNGLPSISNTGFLLATGTTLCFLLIFGRSILDAPRNAPYFDWWLRALLALAGVGTALAFFDYDPAVQTLNYTALLATVSLLVLGVLSVIRGVPQSKFFLIAWAAALFGILLEVTTNLGLLPVSFLGVNGIQIGSLIEALLFSFALGNRIKTLTAEKTRAQNRLEDVEQELELARVIQVRILPPGAPANLSGARIHVRYIPLYAVGGDFYDYYVIDEHRAGIMIADVAGHGVAAALNSSTVKIAFQGASSFARDPEALLMHMNRFLATNLVQTFVSGLYLYLDLKLMHLRLCTAGHPPLFLVREDAPEVISLGTDGTMLGIDEEFQYEARTVELKSGDRILIFTDGLFENFPTHSPMTGLEFLKAAAYRHRLLSGKSMQAAVIAEMDRWRKGDPADDITFLIVEIE